MGAHGCDAVTITSTVPSEHSYLITYNVLILKYTIFRLNFGRQPQIKKTVRGINRFLPALS